MVQREKAEDFVIGTGETHSVKEFVEKAFAVVGIHITLVFFETSSSYFFQKVEG
jgi:GDP-D-mannose dehydratase